MSETYDHVIVGAGPAGSVLARRLVDSGRSVHLLEAGPTDEPPEVHSPQAWPKLLRSERDWAFMTEPQRNANDRRMYWPRGRTLGGSASMNGMVYMRGHPSDYDGWAANGCAGWEWDSVFPYFLRSEDHEDGASAWHGSGGPLPVSRIAAPHPTSLAFIEAARDLGHPPTDDFNGERMVGVGLNHLTVRDGRRVSPWRGFVAPVLEEATARGTLRVTTGAQAHRVLLEGGRAVGVEYAIADGTRDRTYAAYARAEVLLCGGVIGSPRLLLLSGIGPADELTALGIRPAVDLPGVGANLHDHLLVSNVYEASRPLPPGRANLLEAQFFAALDSSLPGPDTQPLFLHMVYPAESYPVPEHGYTLAPGLIRPLSRGTLRLSSADPDAPVLLDPAVLTEPRDLETLVDSVEMCREIGNSARFGDWYRAEVAPGPAARTRDDLRAYVRRAVSTYHHQVGTCRMGQDALAVVDPLLRVRGVAGLRVADASVMPSVPSGNTNAPTVMVGEKAADLVLAAPA